MSADIRKGISIGTLVASVSVFVLTAAAFGSDRAVSIGPKGTAGVGNVAPAGVRAGAPFVGKEGATLADARAEGARVSADDGKEAGGLETVAYATYAEGDAPSVVIGWDSRMRVFTTLYPNRAIVYIERNGNQHSTGSDRNPRRCASAPFRWRRPDTAFIQEGVAAPGMIGRHSGSLLAGMGEPARLDPAQSAASTRLWAGHGTPTETSTMAPCASTALSAARPAGSACTAWAQPVPSSTSH